MVKTKRRAVLKTLGLGALGSAVPGSAAAASRAGANLQPSKAYDVAVVGAGVFGAWTAHLLQKAGRRVALVDQYGPANARASSGGESRVIRMGYGPDEIYTRMSLRSLEMWKALFAAAGQPLLFRKTGVLWMARSEDALTMASLTTLKSVGVPHERLDRQELEKRYPQIAFGPVTWAILEPESGALLARRAVAAVVDAFAKAGGTFAHGAVRPPAGKGRLEKITLTNGDTIAAAAFVFACGPWLPRVVPEALEGRIFPTRQEVFFFGVPAGDTRFSAPQLPTWADFGSAFYGIPDIESRGFKIALDRHGPEVDPDTQERVVTPESTQEVRAYLADRFPALKDAPIVETRVCQYENSSNGDFVIVRHPAIENAWLIGGGSGHGFKHGPAVGDYAASLLLGRLKNVEPRFSVATKDKVHKRTVF